MPLAKPKRLGYTVATAHRENGFEFRIWPNDHAPPHVHAWKAGGMAKIELVDGFDVVKVQEMKPIDVVRHGRRSMATETRVPTDAEILARIPRAVAAAREAERTEPRAAAAAFHADTGRVRIDLTNGCVFEFPARLAQGLAGADPQDLARVEVYPGGEGLRWEPLDVDLSVPGLLAGVFGGEGWMRQLGRRMGRKGGSARTASKARAARENGKKGGRPRKSSAPAPSSGAGG